MGEASLSAVPAELFFSEYIEGTSNNKALEIFNGTGAAIDLAAAHYNVQMYFNGSSTAGLTINLTGQVAANDVYVLAQSSANATILAQADQTNGAGWFNGNDAVVLRRDTTVIDVIGQIGFNPGTEWGTGLTSTADNTLRRKSAICTGDPNGSDSFDPSVEWDGFATDSAGGLGQHTVGCGEAAPSVKSTTPADSATNVAINSNIAIDFSEPVNVTGSWFTIQCSNSGAHSAVVRGGPSSWTLDPDTDFTSAESCIVTVTAAAVSDQDTQDPPDNLAADVQWTFTVADLSVCQQPFTPIYTIQGSGPATPLAGQVVTTQGVVVGDYEGPSPELRGFYVQDATGDGSPATSDGIFVFHGDVNSVAPGNVVRVTGTAEEFQDQSQLGFVSAIVVCGTGARVAPTDVFLPFLSADFPERYEGMLVRLRQSLFVTEHFQLGRFGQIVMSALARLPQPTNVVPPGPAARALQALNNLDRIIIDDARNDQNPDPILFGRGGNPLSASNTLRGGDRASGIVGVMTYTWAGNSASGNAYRVRPLGALGGAVPNFTPANPRPVATPAVGGGLRVVSFNLLNYFNTFSGCTNGVGGAPTDCRGAENGAEFERQFKKTVAAIVTMDADIVGVIEVENNGYGPGSALADLVGRLNAATTPGKYALINVDSATGQTNAMGTDAIKVGLIYKPASVTPVGTTAALNSVAFVNGGDASPRNRPSLAQAFEQPNGARVIVDVNHFKSKSGSCDTPDAGDGQGECNLVRARAAHELLRWLDTDPTGTREKNILVIGDLNAYAKEDPISVLTDDAFTNLIASRIGLEAYSFVFDGQWGYLDHALASSRLRSRVTGVAEWHINADEPSVLDYNLNFKSAGQQASLYNADHFRVSDHDPVIVGLDLQPGRNK